MSNNGYLWSAEWKYTILNNYLLMNFHVRQLIPIVHETHIRMISNMVSVRRYNDNSLFFTIYFYIKYTYDWRSNSLHQRHILIHSSASIKSVDVADIQSFQCFQFTITKIHYVKLKWSRNMVYIFLYNALTVV